jgi:hypothetical protein
MLSLKTWACVIVIPAAVACDTSETPLTPRPESPQFIVNGEPTGSKYGSVGALYYDFNGNRRIEGDELICTGSLIAATVFLTAAHCVEFLPTGAQVYVSFDETAFPRPSGTIAATGFAWDPGYAHDSGDYNDIGVVLLPESATRGMTPFKLPKAGALDALAAKGSLSKTLFVNVGYGFDATLTGVPSFTFDGVRRFSYSEFMGLTQTRLGLLMQTNATGEGGDCYGDSGGPKLIKGEETIVYAIVVTGDVWCRATTWDHRTDSPSARAFLGQYVKLP